MRLTLASAAIAATVALLTPANAQNMTSMDFDRDCRSNRMMPLFCKTYIAGFASGMSYGGSICIPGGVSPDQLDVVVIDWMRTHPAQLNEAPERMMAAAFVAAWPCSPMERARRDLQNYDEKH